MIPSMSRPANPYDNASCENFIKTLKREEIYTNEYVLGYRSPDEFEQQAELVGDQTGATIRFFARTDADSSTGLLGEGAQAPPLPQTPTVPTENIKRISPTRRALRGEFRNPVGKVV
jgi:transposase InsO family protein